MAVGGILQACVEGRTSRNYVKIIEWYSNLYYGIEIFCTKINGIEIFHPILKSERVENLYYYYESIFRALLEDLVHL